MSESNQPSGTPGQLPIDVKNVDENGQSVLHAPANLRNALKDVEAPPAAAKGDTTTTKAEVGTGDKPAPKTYTEDEFNKRIATIQGGHEGTVKKMRGDIAALTAQIAELKSKAEDANLAAYLQSVEAKGGDVEAAKAVAQLQKEARIRTEQIAAREAQLAEREALLNEAGKGKAAHDLMAQYTLPEDSLPKLLEAKDDVDMERIALRLRVEKLTTDSKPPENPPHQTKAVKGVDVSKLPIGQRLGMAMEGQI